MPPAFELRFRPHKCPCGSPCLRGQVSMAVELLETLREVSAELEDHADAEGNSAADWRPNWAMRLQQQVDQAIQKLEK